MLYGVIVAAVIVLYLNVRVTAHLLRVWPQKYELGQMRAQLALIWVLPLLGPLLVIYFLVEGGRPHRTAAAWGDAASDYSGFTGGTPSDSSSDHGNAGSADGGSD